MSTLALLRRFLWVGLTAFGAARWTNLYATFVRTGLIGEREFLRDLAMTQTLPGPTFVNLSVLCGLRLGGLPFALAAVTCVLAPGIATLALALAFLPPDAPQVQGFFHGILIGAIGALASSLLRLSRNLVRALDVALALAAFFIVIAGGSLLVAVVAVGVVGTVSHRWLEARG